MVKYISPIDPHVHLRGTEYLKNNFLKLGFQHARAVGLIAVLEQPNPEPQLIFQERVKSRLLQAEQFRGQIFHGIHIGLTNDENQVRKALMTSMQRAGRIYSDKTFYVHSTGDMGILDQEYQRYLWQIKAAIGYKGVSIGHMEAQEAFDKNQPFDPRNPVTHSLYQTEESELIQTERQLRNAIDVGFLGTFYAPHVSIPKTIDFLNAMKQKTLPFGIVIETTHHHIFLNIDAYKIHGNGIKMNPPLRTQKSQEAVLERVLAGQVDILATDHAPHPFADKFLTDKPKSGIQVIPFWPKGIEMLRKAGIEESTLENLLFYNANRIFQLNLSPIEVDVGYNPRLWDAYGYNPFSTIDGTT